MVRRILAGLIAAALLSCSAFAGNGTITTKDASGVTRTFSIVTDGSGNFIARQVICDATAGANCAAVDASSRLAVLATQTGTWTMQPGNTANTTAWLVTGTGGTFPATQSGTWTVQPGNTANTTPWLTKPHDGTNPLFTQTNPGYVSGLGITPGDAVATQTGSLILCRTTTSITGGSNATYNALNCAPGGGARMDLATVVGTAISVNSGNKDPGTQRNVLATDQLALATWGHGATGSAPPAGATYQGVLSGTGTTGGLLTAPIQCDTYAPFANLATATTAEIVALTASRTIYICGWHVMASGTTSVTLKYGTGTNCGTGTTSLTDTYDLTAQAGLVDRAAYYQGLKGASANALCVTNSAAVKITGGVYYAKF